jgi:hypothetical protein
MRFFSRHWLAGSLLALVLGVGSCVLSLLAQSPASTPAPPGAVPLPGRDSPGTTATGSPPPAVSAPGLPTGRSSSVGIQRQGDLLRFSRNVSGDAKPIVLEADEITSWNEDGQIVLLLSGQVLVQQSVAQARFEQGVAWVDVKRFKTTGILHVDLYAEGGSKQVRVDNSGEVQDGQRAVLDLNTRGEFRIRGARGKVQQRPQNAREPIVSRARGLGLGPRQSAPALTPPAPMLSPPVPDNRTPVIGPPRPTPVPGGQTPGRSPGLSQNDTKPESTDPAASSDLVLVQATTPAPGPGSPSFPSGPPESVPPPEGTPPQPTPSPLPVPTPPSQRRPEADPPSGPTPPPVLPDPTPASPPIVPLPPPSRPAEPPRPGELPRTSTPEQPLKHLLLPRSGVMPDVKIDTLPGGRQIITVTGGLILNVRNVPKIGILDVEADRAVIWVKNRDEADRVATGLRNDQGTPSDELEFYMAGHVILRSRLNPRERSVLEADELYYDARRNVAIALRSRLELRTERLSSNRSARIDEPIILTAPELQRTGPDTFEVSSAEIFSSKLPSDPGLKLLVDKATLTNRERPRTFFGQPVLDKQGKPVVIQESIVEAKNVVAELEGIPFFYTPYLITDARDPLGPLETINLGGNRVLGFQAGVGLNVYKLFGVQPIDGTRWRLIADYMSRRGVALGTNYSYQGIFDSLIDPSDPYDTKPVFNGFVRLYGLYDQDIDILGGNRPASTLTFDPPAGRGRATWRQDVYDLPYGFNVTAQMSLLSDRNFLEQYFKREFDLDPNQANFLYVKQQQDNWAWSALGQARTSNWITTTEWLPRTDAYLLGQDFFGLFTSNTQVSLGYARLRPSSDPPIPLVGAPNPPGFPQAFDATTAENNTARLALLQEIGLPLDLGAFKVVPYLKGALVGYTNDLNGNEIGRAWGGFGTRASLPLTRLYPEVQSELFNLKGLNHKIVFEGNYFYARTNEPFSRFPELDRLHDDATEQMLRESRSFQPVFNPGVGTALATSPYFDPQRYAIRRLVDNRIDTLDDIQVLQLDVRQRLQTKRGFPGAEHIVDWMVLDSSVSFFPQPTKDNFGKPFSFMEYQYLWNIGDRTSFESMGWFDPQDNGARVFTVGTFFNRPDRTFFYLGYRQIDPVQSRVVIGSMTYVFSPKYATTFTTSYDFGTQAAQTNTLIFTRSGTDLQVSLGFMYNSLQNNFGAIVEVVPNLVPIQRRAGATGVAGLMGR